MRVGRNVRATMRGSTALTMRESKTHCSSHEMTPGNCYACFFRRSRASRRLHLCALALPSTLIYGHPHPGPAYVTNAELFQAVDSKAIGPTQFAVQPSETLPARVG